MLTARRAFLKGVATAVPAAVAGLVVSTGAAQAQSAPINGTPDWIFDVTSYLTGGDNDRNGTNDVVGKLQLAHDTWLKGQRAGDALDMVFPSGVLRIDAVTLEWGTSAGDGAGAFGTIRGAGANLTRFVASTAHRMIQVNDMWAGSLGGFSVEGPGKGIGRGVVFAARHADLGTNSINIRDIWVRKLAWGMQFGDDVAPNGAAAELIVDSCNAYDCTIGILLQQWNTLDLQFRRCGLLDCSTGMKNGNYGAAGQVNWQGGSGSTNGHDFEVYGYGQRIVDFRSEPGAQTGPRIVTSFGGNGSLLIDAWLTAGSTYSPVFLDSQGGVHVEMRRSQVVGALRFKPDGAPSSLVSSQNGIYTTTDKPYIYGNTRVVDDGTNWLPNAISGGIPAKYYPTIGA